MKDKLKNSIPSSKWSCQDTKEYSSLSYQPDLFVTLVAILGEFGLLVLGYEIQVWVYLELHYNYHIKQKTGTPLDVVRSLWR